MQAPEGWRPAWVLKPLNADPPAACERADRCAQGAGAKPGTGCVRLRKERRRTKRGAEKPIEGTVRGCGDGRGPRAEVLVWPRKEQQGRIEDE